MGQAQSARISEQSCAANENKRTKGDKRTTGGARTLDNEGKYSTYWAADASLRRDGGALATSSFRLYGDGDDDLADDANCERLVRKLSVVSNRNMQLLALKGKPRGVFKVGQGDNLFTGATSGDCGARRRSSLINMILGTPKAGPRFSDDLCSLDSRLSELCNFGIEFFPDPVMITSLQQHQTCHYSDRNKARGKHVTTTGSHANQQQQHVCHRTKSSSSALSSNIEARAILSPSLSSTVMHITGSKKNQSANDADVNLARPQAEAQPIAPPTLFKGLDAATAPTNQSATNAQSSGGPYGGAPSPLHCQLANIASGCETGAKKTSANHRRHSSLSNLGFVSSNEEGAGPLCAPTSECGNPQSNFQNAEPLEPNTKRTTVSLVAEDKAGCDDGGEERIESIVGVSRNETQSYASVVAGGLAGEQVRDLVEEPSPGSCSTSSSATNTDYQFSKTFVEASEAPVLSPSTNIKIHRGCKQYGSNFRPTEPMASIDLTSSFDNYPENPLNEPCANSSSVQVANEEIHHTSLCNERGRKCACSSSVTGASNSSHTATAAPTAKRPSSMSSGGCYSGSYTIGRGAVPRNVQVGGRQRVGSFRGSELSLYGCCGFSCAGGSRPSGSISQSSAASFLSNVADHRTNKQASLTAPLHLTRCQANSSGRTSTHNQMINLARANLRRSSSLSLPALSEVAASTSMQGCKFDKDASAAVDLLRQTKLIIMLQVCLPFILAGFGNMAAGLAFSRMARWRVFQEVSTFFVLLPSFVGLKGNIEMTLASRLSTLSNLNLLESSHQRRNAYVSNLVLMLSHAIGLSVFATFASVVCELLLGSVGLSGDHSMTLKRIDHGNEADLGGGLYVNQSHNAGGTSDQHLVSVSATVMQPVDDASGAAMHKAILVVLPCAMLTSIILVFISSIVVWWTVWLAAKIQVNPDNLSTLVAALYGDVTCVLAYGLFAEWMHNLFKLNEQTWPLLIIVVSIVGWCAVTLAAYKLEETHNLVISSIPPTVTSIVVSLGSGAILSMVLGRFTRIALYQPVVNGFGANLIAAQASRISTWLWCRTIRKMSKVKLSDRHDIRKQGNNNNQIGYEFEASSLFKGEGAEREHKKYTSLSSFFMQPWSPTRDLLERHKLKKSTAWIIEKLKATMKCGLALIRLLFWSFCNSSPNSTAAKLLLLTIIPAHTLYFYVIWLLSPTNYVVITWPFYLVYMALCLVQVFILLLMCEPMMRFLMRHNMDPDVFGIALLMSLADLIGTLCLTGGFQFLAMIGDPNASGGSAPI